MRGALSLSLLLILLACAPSSSKQQLPNDCRASASSEQLRENCWLLQDAIWRLRQSALLEIGSRKIPMEGFLRLDLQNRKARLVTMNEVGLVLFDLLVDEQGEQLQRAVPQIEKLNGVAQGVAVSLRQLFLTPRPQLTDHLQNRGSSQRLWRLLPGGSLGFIFDYAGDLRETRQVADTGDWRIYYDQYRDYFEARLPERLIYHDFRHGVKLSLWLREVKREP